MSDALPPEILICSDFPLIDDWDGFLICAIAWRTETSLGLAQAILEDQAYDRMPILADALEEAGCDYDPILLHCRACTDHNANCWVLGLVLNKSVYEEMQLYLNTLPVPLPLPEDLPILATGQTRTAPTSISVIWVWAALLINLSIVLGGTYTLFRIAMLRN